jgi:hypothetical protein
VNYFWSVADVFNYTTRRLIKDTGDLSIILDQQGRAKRLPNLPSWVPDWSSSLHGRRSFAHLYNAAKDTQAVVEKSCSPNLISRTTRLDIILDLETAMPLTERYDRKVLSNWSQAVRIKSRIFRDPNNWDTWKIFVADVILTDSNRSDGRRTRKDDFPIFLLWCCSWFTPRTHHPDTSGAAPSSRETIQWNRPGRGWQTSLDTCNEVN